MYPVYMVTPETIELREESSSGERLAAGIHSFISRVALLFGGIITSIIAAVATVILALCVEQRSTSCGYAELPYPLP